MLKDCDIPVAPGRNRGRGTNTLAVFTEPSLMVPRLRSRDAATLITELSSVLHRQGRIDHVESFCQAVINREGLSSTAMGAGWALPHARLAGLSRVSFALGCTAEPLRWFSGESVSTVFLFAVPETEGAAYLGVVAALAKLSQDPLRLHRLANAPDSRTMFEVLQEVSLPGRTAAAVQI